MLPVISHRMARPAVFSNASLMSILAMRAGSQASFSVPYCGPVSNFRGHLCGQLAPFFGPYLEPFPPISADIFEAIQFHFGIHIFSHFFDFRGHLRGQLAPFFGAISQASLRLFSRTSLEPVSSIFWLIFLASFQFPRPSVRPVSSILRPISRTISLRFPRTSLEPFSSILGFIFLVSFSISADICAAS